MKKSTDLILDSNFKPFVSLFWKMNGLGIMEQLVPNNFYCTNDKNSLETIFKQVVWSGMKKVILIGNRNTIHRGLNALMNTPKECRESIEIGFWPLNITNAYKESVPFFSQIGSTLQVFKAGNTIPVDVLKLNHTSNSQESLYYWKTLKLNTHINNADTNFILDNQKFSENGNFKCRIEFHEEELSSLIRNPNNFYKSQKIKLFKYSSLINFNYSNSTFLGKGDNLKIIGNWANLNLNDKYITEPVEIINFEVIKKAFNLIISSIPLRQIEKVKEKFFRIDTRGLPITQRNKFK